MRIISRSTTEQISLAEARLHLKIDSSGSPPTSPEDDELAILIAGVRKFTERYLGRAIVPTTVLAAMDSFPSPGVAAVPVTVPPTLPLIDTNFTLEGGPVAYIQSIAYTDEDGVEQFVDANDYSLNIDGQLARVILKQGASWPATQGVSSAVRVTYIIGNTYTGESPSGDSLDEDVKTAMLVILAWLYREREGEAPEQFLRSIGTGGPPIYIPPAAKLFLGPHILRRRFA